LDNVEIINTGVPGYGLDQMLIYFVREGIKYNPDYVVIFLTSSIASRNFSGDSWKNSNLGSTIYISGEDEFFEEKLQSNSYLFQYLFYNIKLLLLKNEFEGYDKDLWGYLRKENNISKSIVFTRTNSIIKKFEEVTKKNNIELIIIRIDTSKRMLLDADSLSYFDLSSDLRKERKKRSLSFKYDPHYNKETHDFLGEKFTEILRKIIQ